MAPRYDRRRFFRTSLGMAALAAAPQIARPVAAAPVVSDDPNEAFSLGSLYVVALIDDSLTGEQHSVTLSVIDGVPSIRRFYDDKAAVSPIHPGIFRLVADVLMKPELFVG